MLGRHGPLWEVGRGDSCSQGSSSDRGGAAPQRSLQSDGAAALPQSLSPTAGELMSSPGATAPRALAQASGLQALSSCPWPSTGMGSLPCSHNSLGGARQGCLDPPPSLPLGLSIPHHRKSGS